MSLKERLDGELQSVSFTEEEQNRLKRQLVQVASDQSRTRRIFVHFKHLWHGSIEIPLPVAIAAVVVISWGLWRTYAGILTVDHSTVALLFQAGSDSFQVVNQGVSIL
jgi:hypothetical protein